MRYFTGKPLWYDKGSARYLVEILVQYKERGLVWQTLGCNSTIERAEKRAKNVLKETRNFKDYRITDRFPES